MESQAKATGMVRTALKGAEQPILVETGQQLELAAKSWKSADVLGLDTEFVRERTYRADLGLVQLSDGQNAWLVDPLAVRQLSPLRDILHDKSVTKILHSGSEDFEVLWHQLDTRPENVVDSQIACAMLGQSLQLGYHHAVKWLFDVEIDKDQTRSNWLKRPLTPDQHRYAALDVVLLPLVNDLLRQKLENLGRWDWVKEEVERMAHSATQDTATDEAWMRIRGAGSLSGQERKILFSLARWREEKAREKNLARGFVVPDAGLMAMAKARPENIQKLESLDALHPKSVIRYGDTWVDLIESTSSIGEITPLPQLNHGHRKLMKDLKAQVSQTASSLDVDAALLASRKQLESLIFEFEASGDVPERFSGWRQEVITNDLVRILKEQ
ncbi:MAG TPA: ribonuclease D [Xanthomonadales bacterium]|nr:ribonuclease D [Xanthomonadales bacterium]